MKLEVRFSRAIPEPNMACLVGVYAFLIWNNLCDLVYQTPTKSYQSQIPVAFGIPGHVTTRHALLGSGRPPKTALSFHGLETRRIRRMDLPLNTFGVEL